MPEAGYPRDVAGSFICVAQLHRENTPCNDKALLYQLTVLGQGLVERPGADVDGDEDEEDQEQEEAGCRGGRSEELHPQRSLPQPELAGRRPAPRCHSNRPPRNPAFMTGESARADTAPTPRRRAALPPRPHRPRRKSRSCTTPVKCESQTLCERCGEPAAPSPPWRPVQDRPTNPFFHTAPARHPAGGATRAAERPSRRSRAPPTPSHPTEGGGAVRRPQMEDVRGPVGAFCAEPPQSEAAFILFALARRLSQGREGAYKDIYPESWLLEHFLNTPSVPGGITYCRKTMFG